MKFERYSLSTIQMKDKFVVICVETAIFGMFTFTRAIEKGLSIVSAFDFNADEVYNRCGVTKEQATIILNSYHDYLVCCGKYVEIK